MHATLIDITKKEIDLRDGQDCYKVADIPANWYRVAKEGEEFNQTVSLNERSYWVRKVYDEIRGVRYYLVQMSDDKLFEDLLAVDRGALSEFARKKLDEQKEFLMGEFEYKKRVLIQSIKNLPWYKRLFNKF